MATPPPPSPTASPPSASPVSAKKPQPLPWTYEETVQLIRAYQEKWYELRRGQLKSSQWEEVAVTVAARCGYDYGQPSKTAIQCRHKMEKLRQRHRNVKKRLRPGARSGWPFFDLMESMERGPMPISARPIETLTPWQQPQEEEEYNHHGGGGGGHEEDDDEENSNRVQSIDYILRRPTMVNRFSGGKASFFHDYSAAAEKRQREAACDGGDNGDVAEPPLKMRHLLVGLADEIRDFAKRLNGVENKRMEVMKETERCRSEMEKRTIDMILQSEQKIVDSIDTAFGSTPPTTS